MTVHGHLGKTEIVFGRASWDRQRTDGTVTWRQRGIALGVLRWNKRAIVLRLPLTPRTYEGEVIW